MWARALAGGTNDQGRPLGRSTGRTCAACEVGHGRVRCHGGGEHRARLAALTKAQENKAATERFDQIETELKRLRSQKGETTVATIDPVKTLLAAIIGAWADLLTAWQKTVFAVVYDTCLIA